MDTKELNPFSDTYRRDYFADMIADLVPEPYALETVREHVELYTRTVCVVECSAVDQITKGRLLALAEMILWTAVQAQTVSMGLE